MVYYLSYLFRSSAVILSFLYILSFNDFPRNLATLQHNIFYKGKRRNQSFQDSILPLYMGTYIFNSFFNFSKFHFRNFIALWWFSYVQVNLYESLFAKRIKSYNNLEIHTVLNILLEQNIGIEDFVRFYVL